MRTDISRATTAVAAGAGTNSTDKWEKPCGETAWLFLRELVPLKNSKCGRYNLLAFARIKWHTPISNLWEIEKQNPAIYCKALLDLLVLKTLARGAMHGYSIAEFIHETSEDVLRVEEGALYPALHRLELRGLLVSEWACQRTIVAPNITGLQQRGRNS